MGADMLVSSIAFRVGKTAKETTKNVKKLLATAKKRINAYESLKDFGEDALFEFNVAEDASLADVKAKLLADLADVKSALDNNHREGCIIPGGAGIEILVAGGMSWGDEPCELFGSINRLFAAGVIDDLRFPSSTS
jgi:hypothetical protein